MPLPPFPEAAAQRPLPAPRRETLVLALGAMLVVVFSTAAALMLWRSREDALDTWRQYMENFSATLADHAAQTFRTADFVLGRVVERAQAAHAASPEALRRALGTPALHALLREREAELPQVEVVAVLAVDGSVIASSRSTTPAGLNLANLDFHRVHVEHPGRGLFISAPSLSRRTGRWTLYLTRAITSPSGVLLGVALVGIEVQHFERFYQDVNLSDGDTAIQLLGGDDRLLARYPARPEALGRSYRQAPSIQALAQARARGENFATVFTRVPRISNPAEQPARLAAAHGVPGFALTVSATVTEALMLRQWRQTAWFFGAGTLVLDALLVGLTLWIQRLLHRRDAALRQLEAARAAAEDASRVKSQFLANMSHEIRTPLHGMLGMAQLMLAEPLPEAQRGRALTVQRSGRLLQRVIDDVLDFSRIEAGRLELEAVPLDLRGLAQDSLALFAPQALAKGLTLRLEMDEARPAPVLGDPVRLSQILNNLLSNALKFTAAGEVVLRVARLDDGRSELAVRDTGIGLSAAQCARLGEPFAQADSSTTRRYGGSGLGLAIVTRLVRLQGGELQVDSAPGCGAEFRVRLPLPAATDEAAAAGMADAAAPAPAAAAVEAPAGARVLVAEDNDVNRLLAGASLAQLGVEVHEAGDGLAAVREYERARPDLVLMDLHMPELDGLQATERIRALEARQGWPRVPVVALTASVLAEDRRRCLHAGMDEVLLKPFDTAQLRALLARHLQPAASAAG